MSWPDNIPTMTTRMKSIASRSLEIAISQLGVSEIPKGSNKGPQVSKYLKSVGLGPGHPWCMAFVHWCVSKASSEIGVSNPLLKTGGVQMQWNGTILRKLPRSSTAVKPGDLFIIRLKNGTGHTGFVKSAHAGYIETVEGNTNDEGEREGFEVAQRSRAISEITGFIQLP